MPPADPTAAVRMTTSPTSLFAPSRAPSLAPFRVWDTA